MRFPFFRNRDSVKNGILISIRRTGDGFHPGLFNKQETNCSIKSVKSRIFAENALKRIEKEISWKRIIYN